MLDDFNVKEMMKAKDEFERADDNSFEEDVNYFHLNSPGKKKEKTRSQDQE